MTKADKLRRWKAARKRLGLNVREAAAKLGVNAQVAYTWNCGQRPVPDKRLEQIEAMI